MVRGKSIKFNDHLCLSCLHHPFGDQQHPKGRTTRIYVSLIHLEKNYPLEVGSFSPPSGNSATPTTQSNSHPGQLASLVAFATTPTICAFIYTYKDSPRRLTKLLTLPLSAKININLNYEIVLEIIKIYLSKIDYFKRR